MPHPRPARRADPRGLKDERLRMAGSTAISRSRPPRAARSRALPRGLHRLGAGLRRARRRPRARAMTPATLETILRAALAEVDPTARVAAALALRETPRLVDVIAIGKAAPAMTH